MTSFLGLFFVLFAFVAQAEPVTLEARVDLELKNPMSTLNESILEKIRNHHHVMVPGMMNGVAAFFGLYYNEPKEFLSSIGAEYTYLGLPTKISTIENSDFLNLKLREIYENQEIKKPLLLRGHSKGGSEILLTVLRYPDLIFSGIVNGVLLEQAATRGSGLASPRFLSFLNPFSYFYLKAGLDSVQPSLSLKNLDEAFQKFDAYLKEEFQRRISIPSGQSSLRFTAYVLKREEEHFVSRKWAEMSSKIRYVRTYQDPELFSLGTRIVLWTCNQALDTQVPSDGLVGLEDQKDDRIGTDLGILKYDHVSMSLSLVSATNSEERFAIARGILGQFFDES